MDILYKDVFKYYVVLRLGQIKRAEALIYYIYVITANMISKTISNPITNFQIYFNQSL